MKQTMYNFQHMSCKLTDTYFMRLLSLLQYAISQDDFWVNFIISKAFPPHYLPNSSNLLVRIKLIRQENIVMSSASHSFTM